MKKKKIDIATFDVVKKERRSWGQVKPVTTIEKDKRKDTKFERKNRKRIIQNEIY